MRAEHPRAELIFRFELTRKGAEALTADEFAEVGALLGRAYYTIVQASKRENLPPEDAARLDTA